MSDEDALNALHRTVLPPKPRIEIGEAPGMEKPPPSAEDARYADAVFEQGSHEAATIAGIMGMWTGGMILRDLIRESLASETEDEEAKRKKPEVPKDPDAKE